MVGEKSLSSLQCRWLHSNISCLLRKFVGRYRNAKAEEKFRKKTDHKISIFKKFTNEQKCWKIAEKNIKASLKEANNIAKENKFSIRISNLIVIIVFGWTSIIWCESDIKWKHSFRSETNDLCCVELGAREDCVKLTVKIWMSEAYCKWKLVRNKWRIELNLSISNIAYNFDRNYDRTDSPT